ncbi:MAG: class I SAM-dependent methyltransferase [Candidatus Omnitrophica bacterium]|nr:class I SAM-dependent methyltransferase [Candidatus Omnitrophota bacterium]
MSLAVLCEVCRGQEWGTAFRLPTLTVWRCRRCALLRAGDVTPELGSDGAATQHFTAYDLETYRAYYQPFREQAFRRLLSEIQALQPSGRLLDVGCGYGWLLRVAREAGYDVLGVEPSAEVARSARQETGLPVVEGALAVLGDGERFEVITLCNVLEHLPQPRESLRQLTRLLRPDGVLAICVPNIQGLLHRCVTWGYRATGGRWTAPLEMLYQTDNACRHLYHFSPDTLTALVREAGLSVRRCRTQKIIDVDRLELRTRLSPSAERLRWAATPPVKLLLKGLLGMGVWCGLGDELVVVAQRPQEPVEILA